MNKFWTHGLWAISLAMALAIGGCNGAKPEAGPLAGARIGGPFTLVDSQARPVTEAILKGHYSIVYFGYTFCPDVCPMDMGALARGLAQFAKRDPARAAKVQIVFISVDPDRDTPAVVGEFARNFGPQTLGLTGSVAQVRAAARTWGVPFAVNKPAPGAQGYLVDHGRMATLVDPEGKPVVFLSQDEGADKVAATLERWVR